MLILTYLILMLIYVGALIYRKKIMGATIGAIHKGALTLNNRVEEWGKRQIMENPSSPVAKWRYARQWKGAQVRKGIYEKLRNKKDVKGKDGSGQKKDGGKRGHPGDAGAPPPDEGMKANTTGNPQVEPDPEETNNVQTPVEGLEQMPEKAKESFGWRQVPDEHGGGQGDLEVFGPWGKIPTEARKPGKYDVVMEDGKKQTVYGSWEENSNGPVLRENYWSLERTKRAYRIMRDKQGNVFARKIDEDAAKGKRQEAGKETAPQAPQHIRPADYSAPEASTGTQPGASPVSRAARRRVSIKATSEGTPAPGGPPRSDLRGGPVTRGGAPLAGRDNGEKTTANSEKTARQTPIQRNRGPVDFGARYSPGANTPRNAREKTVSETGVIKEEKTNSRTAGAREDIANPDRHGGQPPVIEKNAPNPGGDGSGAGKGKG